MNVYLSARYPRRAELRQYADELAVLDIDVSSTWLIATGPGEDIPTEANAQADLADLYASTVLVTFAEVPNCAKEHASRGGRHVEFGIAYETGIVCIVVAPLFAGGADYQGENVFHLLPGVIRVGSWDEAKALLVAMRERELDEGWMANLWDETEALAAINGSPTDEPPEAA